METHWLSGRARTDGPVTAPGSFIDPVAVRAAAQRIDAAAQIVLGAVTTGLADLQFGPANAGRAHCAGGAAVRAELDSLTADLIRWGRAAAELAAALRSAAGGHEATEWAAAAVLR
ncbi:MAG: hypothetical protein KDB50_12080 [Mycobacterium sp.]|nr:hypothetical protein [Mycobacterium sp.]